jgi:hypothetical protein
MVADYEAFKNSFMEDWRLSITIEYEKTYTYGYTKNKFGRDSTGGTFIIRTINSGYFNNRLQSKNIFW